MASVMHLLCVCFLFATAIQSSMGQNKLFAKFSPPGADKDRVNSFFELPRTVAESGKDGWKVAEAFSEAEGVAVYCRNGDYRMCLLMDRKGSVAGVQISVAAADFQKTNAPVRAQMKRKTVLNTDVYSTRIFFVEKAVLSGGGRVMTPTTSTAPNGVNIPTPTGDYRKIPDNEAEITKTTKFVKQGCIANMGRHYFYNFSKQLKCDDLEIFFALYEEKTHKLAGFGLAFHGVASTQQGGRSWFENPPPPVIKMIAPDGPDCLISQAKEVGVTTIHIYTGYNEPWNLMC